MYQGVRQHRRDIDMKVAGSTVLVTGAAKRIGRAIALELARRGARVAVHYRVSEVEAREALKLIESSGGSGILVRADLTDTDAIDGLVGEIGSRLGTLDVLINNASVFSAGTSGDTTRAMWDEQMDTNARAPFFLAQRAAKVMAQSGRGGKIINLADVAGEVVWPAYFAYSVSKAALLAATRGLAKAYAPAIQVNALSLGPVHFPEHYSDEQKRLAVDRTLLKRAGSPDDVVRAVLFLVENDYITGDVIHVDGGRHAF